MAEYIIQDSTLQGIADAIRSKTGDTAPIQTDAFANAISLIETGGGGDTSVEDGLIEGTLTEYTNGRVTSVRKYAFYDCTVLTSVNFPIATSIYNHAFYDCYRLASVNFPIVTEIGGQAFYSCTALTSVNFPAVTMIGDGAFSSCTALTSVNFPVATRIGPSTFSNCTALTNVNFPAVNIIASSAFCNCTALTNVNFPAVTKIFPYAFRSCSALTTLYLTGSTVCILSNSNAFSKAGITSSTGSIYIPASLLTAYQTATNWAYFATQFVPIEG